MARIPPWDMWIVLVALLAALGHAAPAWSQDEDAEPPSESVSGRALATLEWAVDLAVIRPLSVLQVAVGAVAIVPVAVLSAPGGLDNVYDAYDTLVRAPTRDAFQRDLGDFGERDW